MSNYAILTTSNHRFGPGAMMGFIKKKMPGPVKTFSVISGYHQNNSSSINNINNA